MNAVYRMIGLWLVCAVLATGCASGPRITQVQEVPDSADTPYDNVLVVALFGSFEARFALERDIVKALGVQGADAVAATSRMKTTTPMTRQLFAQMAEDLGVDSVLVTQLVSAETTAELKDANPQASYKVSPTYYFNVWEVQLTEFIEPPIPQVEGEIVLSTQLFSARLREVVWAVESKFNFVQRGDPRGNYTYYQAEAQRLVDAMVRDRLIIR